MPQSIYQRYAEAARKAGVSRNTKTSVDWFRKRIRKDRASFGRAYEPLKGDGVAPGKLMIYEYDPKYKDTLQYYDRFPCTMIIEMTENGWYGLNLHYLPPAVRARLLADTNVKTNAGLKIANAIGNSRFGKPALHRYIGTQCVSKPKSVPQKDWEIAIQLPFEGFVKVNQSTVWRKANG